MPRGGCVQGGYGQLSARALSHESVHDCVHDGLLMGMRQCTVAGLRWFPQMDLRAY